MIIVLRLLLDNDLLSLDIHRGGGKFTWRGGGGGAVIMMEGVKVLIICVKHRKHFSMI